MEWGSLVSFEAAWLGASFRGRSVFEVRDGLLHPVGADADADLVVPGTLLPRLTDHHVHLGLIDPSALMPGGLTHVIDLGGDPAMTGRLRDEAALRASPDAVPPGGEPPDPVQPDPVLPAIHIAGAFLTCVDGYPKGRSWASDDAVVELERPEDAESAVQLQAAHGASVIKVTLNSVDGPVPSPELLTAIVRAARAEGIPVAAHVEGEGMTRRALDAGVNVLAHTPFTERLEPELVARLSRARTSVVSTLDIHGWGEPTDEFAVASDNLRRLAAAGTRVVYGTDLGNGPLPVGVNGRELEAIAAAGVGRNALVAAVAGAGHPDAVGPRLAWVPGAPPQAAADAARWLTGARATTVGRLADSMA
jgi:hypothetical protein